MKGGAAMRQVLNLSVVTFQADWGDKESNLARIADYINCAARQGSNMVVFPEMSLTGYDDQPEKPSAETMQAQLAEPVPGPAAQKVAELAWKNQLYVLFGMPERVGAKVYNTLAVCTPEGKSIAYRKLHLALSEPHWAEPGVAPLLFATPWGPVGCLICFDAYSFPELMRYYAAKGCRLCVNATAFAKSRNAHRARTTIEAAVLQNDIFIASANLGGLDHETDFLGGSSIAGPSQKYGEVHYYAGQPFDAPGAFENGLYTAAIDLSRASRRIYQRGRDRPADFRPGLYAKLYGELDEATK